MKQQKHAKLFRTGQSQAVRLPKKFRFEGSEVEIKKIGNAVLLTPVVYSWDRLLKTLAMFPDVFEIKRDKPDYKEEGLF